MPNLSSFSSNQLRRIAGQSFSGLVLGEIGRAKERVSDLERTFPSAERRELARRLVDSKRALASTAGAVSGLFGLLSVPLDLVFVTYLQVSLLVDVATLFRVNLKSERAQSDLLDLLGYANGTGPILRASPPLVGRIAMTVLQRRGLPAMGRAVPVVAAPLTAWLNNKALARAGDEAIRFYARETGRQKA